MTRREASQTSHRFPGAASRGAWAATAVALLLAAPASSTELAFGAPASSAGLSFGAPAYYPSGSYPNAVLLADLDRDNDLDAIVSGTSSNIVTLFWNRGDGVFENRVDYPAGVPVYATVGDLDGDTWPDVAVAGWGGSVTILFSPGEGPPTIVNVAVGQNPRSITALDLEGDGDLDLAVTRYSAGTVALLVNTGGVFTLGAEVPARPAKSITAADIDADGKPDLITGSHEGYVTILRQTGAGGFARTDLSAGGIVSMAVAVDLNADGKLDLATANEDNSASVLLNLGAGIFAPRVLYTVGNLAQSLDTGDIDDDGDMDLVVANYSQNTASILSNDGAGAFPQIQAFAAGDRPRDVVAGDVNGDGQIDLATSNDLHPGSFAIVLNTAIAGNEGFLPAVSYPTGMTPYAIALGDLDRDGDPDAIVSCAVARAITVSMNQGNGTFANRVDYPAGLAVHTAVGDFDGDSWPDVAVADWDGSVRVMRFVNGSLVSSATVSLSGNPRAVVAVDLDGDGDLDLAVARYGSQDVALLSNSGGAFTHTGTTPVPQPKSVTAGDLDSDGVPEIISGSPQGSVSILKRNAVGSYVVTTLTMGSLVSMVVAADLNGDGHRDLATANESSTASVRLNFGNGTFAPHANYTIGPLAQSLGVGDVDVDGDPDLVVASYTAQSVRVLFNFAGVFPANLEFATDGRPRGLAVGDVNGDGAPDLAAANETALGSFAVLINKEYGGVTLTPAAGAPGMVVRIRALGLNGTSEVWFGETPAMFQVVADTLVEAEVPEGARTGPVRVHTPLRVIHGPVFIVSPMILSFVPTVAPAGGAVTLFGYNFANVDTVRFNGVLAPFTIVSDAEIQTEVPLDATDGPITAWNPGGTGTSSTPFNVAPVPLILSFTPGGGAQSTPVTLRGRFFTGVTQVSFGSAGAAFTVASDSVVLTTVPVGARTGLIHVTSPEGAGMSATPFIVAPEVVHFRPRALTGDTISILGRNFEGVTGVAFGGVSAAYSVVSDSVLIATVPDQATEGLVFVTNPGGTTASATAFLPAYVPVVTTLDPAAGAPGAAVAVRGLHFLEVVSVSFLNAPAIFTITSDSTIVATIPDEALTGPVSVATPYATGVSAMAFMVAPWITHHTPSGVPGDTVTIIGHNFGGTTQVSFNGAIALFNAISEELIEATVPDDVTDGPLLMTNPGGTTASASSFTVGPHVRGINLSWNDCGAAGDSVKTFACDINTGVDHLVATFVPPRGINRFVGLSADLRIAATSLPDWWKHGAGQCRPGGSLVPEFDVPGEACATAWPGTQAGGFSYELGSYGANTARLRLQAAVPSEEAFALVDGLEYYAFRVRVARAKTTGAGSCAGCLVPVQVRLENIQLFQPADANRDPLLDAPIHGATAYWQGITGAQPQIASITPAAGPPGAGVTILGAGLSAASSVRFGNTEAVFAEVSDTQLSATIPGGARTAPVRVTTPFGSAVGGGDFIVSPEIDFFLPEQGPEGSEVTIFGHNLGTATAVAFQGLPATFAVQTDTSIVATVPAGAGDGPITVTNPGGATASFESFRVGPSAGVFNLSWDECGLAGGEIKTFACNTNSGPPFTLVASFAPPANVTEVTGLSADIRVSSPAYPDWWKIGPGACRPGSQLFATGDFATGVACSDFLTVGAYGSAVGYTASYYGPGTARLSILMTYNVPPSATLDPTREYYGFKLNIGRQRTVSDGACAHCDRPVALALEQIRIHRAGGAEDVAITSTFRRSAALWQGTPQPPPDLSSFSPPGGDVGAQVDLHGVRFAGVTSVRFGAVEAEFTINSDALITALMPEGATTAPIEVTSIYGSDVSDRSFVFAPDIRDVAADPSSDETRARNEIPEVLALDRVAWDAGASALAVTVALPRTGPASFEMFDVSGRRLAGQRLDGLGAGTHELSLRPAVPLRPGVHFVRLTLNRESVSRRFVVVQ